MLNIFKKTLILFALLTLSFLQAQSPTSEKWCYNGDIELWTQSFGNPEDPAILMIMGAMNQGILWPDELCHRLADQGYFVLRYDHRDVGQSSTVDFVSAPYTLTQLKNDALLVLEGYGLSKAHILGVSMGGVIGGQLACEHPEKVHSLILMMSTPDLNTFMHSILGVKKASSLPPPSDEFIQYINKKLRKRGKGESEKIDLVLEGWKICNGNHLYFPEDQMYELQQRVRLRARSMSSAFNHILALFNSDLNFQQQLKSLQVPTLIIHGRQDPCLPLAHGESLSQLIEGSRLEVVEEMGHLILPELSEKITHLVSHHTEKFKKKNSL